MLSERTIEWLGDHQHRVKICSSPIVKIAPSTLRAYRNGIQEPRPRVAAALIQKARQEGVELSWEDFFGDPLNRSTNLKKEAIA